MWSAVDAFEEATPGMRSEGARQEKQVARSSPSSERYKVQLEEDQGLQIVRNGEVILEVVFGIKQKGMAVGRVPGVRPVRSATLSKRELELLDLRSESDVRLCGSPRFKRE